MARPQLVTHPLFNRVFILCYTYKLLCIKCLKLSKINIISCLGPPVYYTFIQDCSNLNVDSCRPGFTTEHDDTPHHKAKKLGGCLGLQASEHALIMQSRLPALPAITHNREYQESHILLYYKAAPGPCANVRPGQSESAPTSTPCRIDGVWTRNI
jgi:hypothetical protein